jgi:hypothetical protein
MFSLRSNPARLACSLVMAAGLLALVIAGCKKSAPTGNVQGKVLLNDAPYADAAVVFLSPTTGQGGTADIQPGGTFRLEQPLPVGKYTVFLAPKSGGAAEEEPKPVSIDQAVPDKYWNEASSDISVDVNEGENDFTIPLKK